MKKDAIPFSRGIVFLSFLCYYFYRIKSNEVSNYKKSSDFYEKVKLDLIGTPKDFKKKKFFEVISNK